jgi:hypothetical protein
MRREYSEFGIQKCDWIIIERICSGNSELKENSAFGQIVCCSWKNMLERTTLALFILFYLFFCQDILYFT